MQANTMMFGMLLTHGTFTIILSSSGYRAYDINSVVVRFCSPGAKFSKYSD